MNEKQSYEPKNMECYIQTNTHTHTQTLFMNRNIKASNARLIQQI